MKKLLLIAILMLALVVTIVACNKTPEGTDTTVADTTVETPTEDATTEEATTEEPTEEVTTEEPTTEEVTTEEPTTEEVTTEEPTEAPTADPADPVWIIEPDDIASAAATASSTVAEVNEAGFIRLTSTGGDPWVLIAGNLGTMPNYLAIRYRTNTAQAGEFFIGSDGGPAAGNSFVFNWNGNEEWNLLVFDLAANVNSITDGVIGHIRFDFFTGGGEEGAYMDVEYVALFNTAEYALAYDFELNKAPMWDENKDVVIHQNFDQFFLGDGNQDDAVNNDLNFYHAINKPDWDKVADITTSDYTALTYWGWVALASETVGQFGYQVNMDAPIFDDAWTHATEQPVIDASIGAGGATGTRMKITINTADFDGETKVRVLYKDAEGNTVCLNEITVIAPVKAKDITDTFASDLASNAADTAIDATDLNSFFQFGLNLGDYKTTESAYKINGISEMFADVNGKYFIKTNFVASNANCWSVVRGYRVVNSDEIIEKFDPAGGFYKINNYYETDMAGACGGAGIYARADGTNLTVMIKYYNTETATRVGNKVYTIPAEGTELTMADDSETVYIMVNGTTYMTIALDGSVVYEDINEVSPKNGFAATATVTLADGTTETIENTLIADTCECQVALVIRSGDFLFSSVEVGAFSAVENPGFETDEPTNNNVVIDLSTVEGYKPSNNYGYDCPIIDIGYNEVYLLGNIDLTQYAQIIIEYSYDGDTTTDRAPEQCWTDCDRAPIIGFTAINKCFGYANVTNQDAIDMGVYTEMPYTPGNWAAATRTATIEIPENIGYNGPCYLSAYNPWGRTIAVASITLVPRA